MRVVILKSIKINNKKKIYIYLRSLMKIIQVEETQKLGEVGSRGWKRTLRDSEGVLIHSKMKGELVHGAKWWYAILTRIPISITQSYIHIFEDDPASWGIEPFFCGKYFTMFILILTVRARFLFYIVFSMWRMGYIVYMYICDGYSWMECEINYFFFSLQRKKVKFIGGYLKGVNKCYIHWFIYIYIFLYLYLHLGIYKSVGEI